MQFAGVEAPAETALNGKQTGDGRAVRVKLPFMEVTFCSRARTRSRIRSFFEGLANPGIKQQHDSSPFSCFRGGHLITYQSRCSFHS